MSEGSRLTKSAVDVMAYAVAAALVGQPLRLYAGARGGESTLLCEFEFPEKYTVSANGLIKFDTFDMRKARATGDASWFQAGLLIEGSAGKNGDMPIDDPRIYTGMELTLDGFEYQLSIGDGS